MALAVDSEMPSNVGNASASVASTLSYAFNNVGGTLLVCGVTYANGTVAKQIGGVTYDGKPLERLISFIGASGGALAEMWGILNPSIGSKTLAIAASAGANNFITSGCISFTGHALVHPYRYAGYFSNSSVTSTTANVAVTNTKVGNIVLDCCCAGGTIGTSLQTLSWLQAVDVSTVGDNGAMSRAAGTGGTVQMGYTIASGTDDFAIVAIEINALANEPAFNPSPPSPVLMRSRAGIY